jgi:hypothetical protein
MIEQILLLLPERLILAIKSIRNRHFKGMTIWRWRKSGCPLPPPHQVKLSTIEEYQKKSGYSILVETGTFKGDTIEAERNVFEQIISVELGRDLYEKAVKRFKKYDHISLYHGDSGKVLKDIVAGLKRPAIFWLDGHYSGGVTARGEKDCPIFEEVEAIFQKGTFRHILLIDDAECFTGQDGYPTIEELTDYIKGKCSNYEVEVKYGVIRAEVC